MRSSLGLEATKVFAFLLLGIGLSFSAAFGELKSDPIYLKARNILELPDTQDCAEIQARVQKLSVLPKTNEDKAKLLYYATVTSFTQPWAKELVQALLKVGADPNFIVHHEILPGTFTNEDVPETVLGAALSHNEEFWDRFLLNEDGSLKDLPKVENYRDVVHLFLDHGADVNSKVVDPHYLNGSQSRTISEMYGDETKVEPRYTPHGSSSLISALPTTMEAKLWDKLYEKHMIGWLKHRLSDPKAMASYDANDPAVGKEVGQYQARLNELKTRILPAISAAEHMLTEAASQSEDQRKERSEKTLKLAKMEFDLNQCRISLQKQKEEIARLRTSIIEHEKAEQESAGRSPEKAKIEDTQSPTSMPASDYPTTVLNLIGFPKTAK